MRSGKTPFLPTSALAQGAWATSLCTVKPTPLPASGQVNSHPYPLRAPPSHPGQHACLSHACSCDARLSLALPCDGQGAVRSQL